MTWTYLDTQSENMETTPSQPRGVAASHEEWLVIADRVGRQMAAQGLSAAALARSAKVSKTVVGQLLKAEKLSYRISTLWAVSEALGWEPTAITNLLLDASYMPRSLEERRELDQRRAESHMDYRLWKKANDFDPTNTAALTVASKIRARVAELATDFATLAEKSGIPTLQWVRLYEGVLPTEGSWRRTMSTQLHWSADSIDRIFRGEDPIVDHGAQGRFQLDHEVIDAPRMKPGDLDDLRAPLAAADSIDPANRVNPNEGDLAAMLADLMAEVRATREEVAQLRRERGLPPLE